MDLPDACTVMPKSGRSRLVLALYVEGMAWFLPRSLGGTGAAAIYI